MSTALLEMDWREKDCCFAVGNLSIYKSFRFLPKRRLTGLARRDGKDVIVKCFAQKSEYLSEKNSYEQVRAAGFSVPALLDEIHISDGYLLVFEYIKDTVTWSEMSSDEMEEYFLQLVDLFKKLHQKHFYHQDPHLENFLVTEHGLTLIDFSAIRKKWYLDPLRAYWNFAYLLVQIYPTIRMQLKPFIDSYLEKPNSMLRRFIMQCVRLQHRKRMKRYQKKLYRDCTEFAVYRYNNVLSVSKRDLRLPTMFDPETLPVERYLKQGNTATVWLSELRGQPVVVKRYNNKGFVWRFRHSFKTPRGRLSWQNAHLMQQNGLKTPRPLAYIEKRSLGLIRESYFIASYIPGQPAHLYVESNGVSESLLQALNTLFIQMRQLKLCQSDAKASNILISEQNNQPYIIDLDSVRAYKVQFLFNRKWKKIWARWLRNWQSAERDKFKQIGQL